MSKSYSMDMCSGSVIKKMLLFSFPLMASGVLQLLFNAADVVVLGKFAGDDSMGAVGSTSSLINLFTNLFVGLAVGVNVLAARAHGASSRAEMRDIVHTSVLLSAICGVVIGIIGALLAPEFLILMHAPDTLLPLATTYLRIYFLGMPAVLVYNFGAAILRAVGDTKRPLYFLLTAGVVNLLLNLLFVIAFKMDTAGVALATIISQYISAFLTMLCLVKEQSSIHLDFRRLAIKKYVLLSIVRVGLPAGFQGMLFSLSNVVIQSSVNLFGDATVDGNTAAQSIEGFIYMAMNTFYQAAISFTGQHVGAKKFYRIPKIIASALLCVTVTGLALGWIAFLFGRPLLGIYSNTPEVIEAGMRRMAVISTTYALCGCMDVMVGMLRGLGRSIMPMLVSLAGACGLRLLWIATIFQVPDFHNITTLYISYPISWGITFVTHIICYIIVWRGVKKREADSFAQQN